MTRRERRGTPGCREPGSSVEHGVDIVRPDDARVGQAVAHEKERCPQGIGIVGGLRCKSRRLSLGRGWNQLMNRTSCLTASSYATFPFSGVASSASPSTPVGE